MAEYLIPGGAFHDETVDEGQFLDAGEAFIDTEDAASPPAAALQPVIFVCT